MQGPHLLKRLWLVLVWLGTLPLAAASPPAALRWNSTDGRSFDGVFLGRSADAAKFDFAGPAGIRLAVDPEKLAAADRMRLEDLTHSGAAALAASLAAPFRPAPSPERSRLPMLNQKEFGMRTNNCFPNACAAFLLWWDQQGVLAVPRQGDPHTKAVWLHERLIEYCATTQTHGTSTRDAQRGLCTYFQRHLSGTATLRVHTDYDCAPANLARYPVGLAACLLNLTLYDGDTKQGGHFVALVQAKPDGTIHFRTWGIDFHGKLRVLEKLPAPLRDGPRRVPATRHEIDLTHTSGLPKWFRQLHIRFILDPAEWNGLTVAVPYIYLKTPGTAPAPPDPLFEGLESFYDRPNNHDPARPRQSP